MGAGTFVPALLFFAMEEARPHKIEIKQEHRYFTLGKLHSATPAIWMVCHGYGQLAPYFIRHFQVLADAGHFIIAPEGFSRFYLQGRSGRVGASWMTREDRQSDIHNNVLYLSEVYRETAQGHSAPLNLLGFSQGVATLCRWVMLSEPDFSRLVLWAGVFPDDLPPSVSTSMLASKRISLVFGDEDPFLTEEKKEEQLRLFWQMDVHPQVLQFKGKHEINQEILKTNFIC